MRGLQGSILRFCEPGNAFRNGIRHLKARPKRYFLRWQSMERQSKVRADCWQAWTVPRINMPVAAIARKISRANSPIFISRQPAH